MNGTSKPRGWVEPRSTDDFLALVARHYKMTVDQLLGPRRHQAMMPARRTAYWGLRTMFKRSYPEVGQAMRGRDHATVMHSMRRVTNEEKRTALSLFYDVDNTDTNRLVLDELEEMLRRYA